MIIRCKGKTTKMVHIFFCHFLYSFCLSLPLHCMRTNFRQFSLCRHIILVHGYAQVLNSMRDCYLMWMHTLKERERERHWHTHTFGNNEQKSSNRQVPVSFSFIYTSLTISAHGTRSFILMIPYRLTLLHCTSFSTPFLNGTLEDDWKWFATINTMRFYGEWQQQNDLNKTAHTHLRWHWKWLRTPFVLIVQQNHHSFHREMSVGPLWIHVARDEISFIANMVQVKS